MDDVKQLNTLLSSGASIKQKLVAIIMAVSSIALIVSSILVILFAMSSFEDHLIEELSTRTKIIAYNCSAAVIFDDATDTKSVLEALRAHPITAYAQVSRLDKSILATYRRDGFNAEPQNIPLEREQRIEKDWVIALEPIFVDGKNIGSVFVQADLSEYYTFQRQIITVVLIIFVTVLLATFLLSSMLQRRISGPIEHLTRTAKNVSETRDYSLRALQVSNDEIGLLTNAFNNMLSEIEQRNSDLQEKDFVISSSSTAIATCDMQGLLTYVNSAFLSMWGFDHPNEVLGHPLTEFWMVDNQFDDLMTALKEAKGKWNAEHKAKRRDKSLFNTHASAATVLNAKGDPIGLMFTSIDISQRKKAEEERDRLYHDTDKRVEELRCMYGVAEAIRTCTTQEQMFKDVVQLIPLGWHYPEITRARIRFDDQEYVSQSFEDTEWKQSSDIIIDDTFCGNIEVFYLEECPPQDEGPFLNESRVLIDGIAQALGESVVHRRAQTERDRLLTAIEQAEEAVIITDTDANIQYVSPSFERITGYTREEVIGQNPRFLQSGVQDKAFFQTMWDALTRGETWTGQVTNKKKDGTLFTEEETISPVHDASGKTTNYIAVKRDITHEMGLEAQLRQAQKMEAVGQLAGGIAHDFNNLLQVIMGYGEIALNDLEEQNASRESIEEIIKAGHRAKSLVNQMLAFSRRQVLEMKDVDLNDIIADLMKMIPRVIGEHIRLNVIPSSNLGVVRADPGQIEQILMNLCVNARDAMPKGGTITIETQNANVDEAFRKAHSWAGHGQYALLSVSDTGSGMDEETLEKLFEPFFTTKDVGKGSGLGLATVYGLVKQHKGGIHVYSEIETGTIFKIYLPLTQHSAQPISHTIDTPVPGGTETILLSEDDESVRYLTTTILKDAGYTVFTSVDGEDALRVFEEHTKEIDLALLDVMMPKLGGEDVYERMIQVRPEIRVLFASGYSMNALHTDYVLDHGLALIQKPYHHNDLLRRVREILDGSSSAS